MHPCHKRTVTCLIVARGGVLLASGQNSCDTEGFPGCPRVEAGCPGGEGLELCGPPLHAETAAVQHLAERFGDYRFEPFELTAYIFGNDWVCRACQYDLQAAGVYFMVIM
jgi:deoxycytidylate deaminase